MGSAKRMMEQEAAEISVALEMALSAGVLSQCERHELYFRGSRPPATAYAMANAKFNRGDVSVFSDREAMNATLSQVIEEHAVYRRCSHCVKNEERDD